MARVKVIHEGFVCPEPLLRKAEEWGSEATVGTARMGGEATVGDETPELVITDSPEIRDFWEGRGVSVNYVGEEGAPAESVAPSNDDEEFGLDVEGTSAADEAVQDVPGEPSISEELEGEYDLQERGRGWYNVVGPDGEVQNDSALREDDAIELRDKLNAGEVTSG